MHQLDLRSSSPLLTLGGLVGLGFVAAALACSSPAGDSGKPGVEVLLCDGESKLSLDRAPASRAEGQAVADRLMSEWLEKHPDASWASAGASAVAGNRLPREETADWELQVRSQYWIQESADNSGLVGGQSADHPGGAVTESDIQLWKRETERLVAEGARIFHSSDELNSTIAVSCDMCHPDAANTHPESYPKYQVQIGRAVLLRDMINWCLQHPVRAQPWPADDSRMIAVEAYILAQRRGKPLDFGRR